MGQIGDKLKEIWKISGSLEKRYYFKPMTILILAIWILALFSKISGSFSLEIGLEFFDAILFYFNELLFVIIAIVFLYINTRFYPWVAIVLSQLPFFDNLFKIDQSFLDSIVESYRKSKGTVDRIMPKINVQEYRVNPFRGNLERSRRYSNSEERTSKFIDQLIVNYLILTVVKFFAVYIVYNFSWIIGWFAIPYVIRKMYNI